MHWLNMLLETGWILPQLYGGVNCNSSFHPILEWEINAQDSKAETQTFHCNVVPLNDS